MSSFIPFDRSQPYLLPPDLKSWLPADDMAHFIVAAVERVPMDAFCVPVRTGGKAQYHPRLILALLIFSHANGLFSLRRIERATYRDIGVRVSWRRTCIWITTRLPLFGGRTGQPLKRHLRRSCFSRA
ncbi:transposase [Komagataeibacter medellinensis NBRC 3288]|uniref:Transposase n=1 Tax=Komagataeibacter medellinensis (strain NBRC 3288 / BCRC 11682 / LMG 1693 / Kondo 51) TaxID=634177 RepID=G2I004_KOMMN|nr:transposase [Komagataeibacter medellinensis NBRC 3288]